MHHGFLRVTVFVGAVVLAYPVRPVANETTPTTGAIAASDHTCALTVVGGVTCWGDNSTGGLGNGTTTASSTPVDVVGLTSGFVAVATGDRSSCALTTSGGVKCWGFNGFGQLGDGTTTDRTRPVDVTGLTSPVISIAARGEHACALSRSGVRCWGANSHGQLGDGTTIDHATPVEVAGLADGAVSISAGGEHTCAISGAGGAWCWGWNANGELGDGTTVDRASPAAVTDLGSGVSAIATGGRHTCALTTAGRSQCWGYNALGQLGDGTAVDRARPVDVGGLPASLSSITAGGNFTCSRDAEGGVRCWGDDSAGQLGDGPATWSPGASMVDVTGLATGVRVIAAGYYHVCGITNEGRVTCWGGNESGQLGNGTTTDSGTPVDVRKPDGTPLIAAHSVADGPPIPTILIAAALGLCLTVMAGWLVSRRLRRR